MQRSSTSWLPIRIGRVAWRMEWRTVRISLIGGLVLCVLAMLSMMVGEYALTPVEVIQAMVGQAPAEHVFIVMTLRLPRLLVAMLVGGALGLSGSVFQALMRNPLADAGILGVSSGAGLVVVALIVIGHGVADRWLSVAAFAGGMLTALIIYMLAWRHGDTPLRLILVGIGVGAVTSALVTLMTTYGAVWDVQQAMVWLAGSLYASSWRELWELLRWVLLTMPVLFAYSREVNLLALGDELARGVGIAVTRQRMWLLALAVALASSSVAAAGVIGFVGLMAPHIARRLVGSDYRNLMPVSAVIGAIVLLAADVIGRSVIAPRELPVGLVTAMLGAPFFLGLLWRQRKGVA